MIDLYETRNGSKRKVAECPFDDVLRIGLKAFYEIQKLQGREIVLVRGEGEYETRIDQAPGLHRHQEGARG